MSNRWNQTRAVNRRPKVCLSKTPIPNQGSPAGPCSITPALYVRTVAQNSFFTLLHHLESLNDVPQSIVPLDQQPPTCIILPGVLTVGATRPNTYRAVSPPGLYDITLTAILPSGCNPSTRLSLRII